MTHWGVEVMDLECVNGNWQMPAFPSSLMVCDLETGEALYPALGGAGGRTMSTVISVASIAAVAFTAGQSLYAMSATVPTAGAKVAAGTALSKTGTTIATGIPYHGTSGLQMFNATGLAQQSSLGFGSMMGTAPSLWGAMTQSPWLGPGGEAIASGGWMQAGAIASVGLGAIGGMTGAAGGLFDVPPVPVFEYYPDAPGIYDPAVAAETDRAKQEELYQRSVSEYNRKRERFLTVQQELMPLGASGALVPESGVKKKVLLGA